MVAVNEVSAEDATTEPKHLLNPLVIYDFKSQIYIPLCLVVQWRLVGIPHLLSQTAVGSELEGIVRPKTLSLQLAANLPGDLWPEIWPAAAYNLHP